MGFAGLFELLGIALASPAAAATDSASAGDWLHVDPSGARIIRASGRLVVNPTQDLITGVFPYGGTEIGAVRACLLQATGEPYVVEFEGLGGVGDVLEPPHTYTFACFVRGWDDRALELLLPDHHATGSFTRHSVFEVPGGAPTGSSEIPNAVKLLFVPDDPLHAPGVILYRAIAGLADDVVMSRREELGLPLVFDIIDDGSRRLLQVGRIVDLDL